MCSADSAQRNRRFANFLNSVFQNAKNANFAIPKSPLQVSVIQLFRHVPKESCNDQRTTGRLTMDSRTSAIGGAAAGNLSTAGGIIGAAVNNNHEWQSSLAVINGSHPIREIIYVHVQICCRLRRSLSHFASSCEDYFATTTARSCRRREGFLTSRREAVSLHRTIDRLCWSFAHSF